MGAISYGPVQKSTCRFSKKLYRPSKLETEVRNSLQKVCTKCQLILNLHGGYFLKTCKQVKIQYRVKYKHVWTTFNE